MKITITLSEADARTLIMILASNKDAAAIVNNIKSALNKDKASTINRQLFM